MNIGTITFSFDDGRKDTYDVFKNIMISMNLPAVVYIPSGYIEIGFNDSAEIGFNGLMSKENLDFIEGNGLFEIGGHGFMHKNDFEDLKLGIKKLKNWYPDIGEIGLASPHSYINKTFVENNIKRYKEMGFKYVRGGRNFEKFTSLKRVISLIARKTKSPKVFCLCYKNSTNKEIGYYLHAIPIHKLTTLDQVKSIVDYCVENKVWAILEFHGIDTIDSMEYTEDFCWLKNDFIELCNYVKNFEKRGVLQVRNPIDMVKEE